MKIHEQNEVMSYLTRPGMSAGGRVGFANGTKVKFPQNQFTKISGNSLNDPDYLEILNERIWQKKPDGSLLYEDTAFRDLAAPNGNVITNREMRALQKAGYTAPRSGKKVNAKEAAKKAKLRRDIDPNYLKDKAKQIVGRDEKGKVKSVIQHPYPKRLGETAEKLMSDKEGRTLFSEAESTLQNLDIEKEKLLKEPLKNKRRIEEIQAIQKILIKGKNVPTVTSTSPRTNKPVTKTNLKLTPKQKGFYGYENVDIDEKGNLTKKLKGADLSQTMAGLSDDPLNKVDFRNASPEDQKKLVEQMASKIKGSSGPTLEFKPGMQPDGQLKDLPGGNKKGLNLGIGKTLSKAAEVIGTPAAAALFAADTVRGNIAKGQSLTDAVVDPMVGAELLFPSIASKAAPGVMKGILGLGKVGRAFTPVGAALTVAGQGQEFYNQLKELQRLKEEDPEAYETFMDSRISDPLTAEEQMQIEDMGREGAMYGGRMGFDKGGPSNKDRRKFMKVVGGLATLPIFGKYFKLGEKAVAAAKVVIPKITKTAGMPDWFPGLVKRALTEGTDVSKVAKTVDGEIVKRVNIKGTDVDVRHRLDTGEVGVKVHGGHQPITPGDDVKIGDLTTAYDEGLDMTYLPGKSPKNKLDKPKFKMEEAEARWEGNPYEPDISTVDVDTELAYSKADLKSLELFSKNKTPTFKDNVKINKKIEKNKGYIDSPGDSPELKDMPEWEKMDMLGVKDRGQFQKGGLARLLGV